MDTTLRSANENDSNPSPNDALVIALASTVALAAAGTLLACSLLPVKRLRLSIPSQICLGALVAVAGAITWKNREEEFDAARHVMDNVHQARDARWLRKNPIAYA